MPQFYLESTRSDHRQDCADLVMEQRSSGLSGSSANDSRIITRTRLSAVGRRNRWAKWHYMVITNELHGNVSTLV